MQKSILKRLLAGEVSFFQGAASAAAFLTAITTGFGIYNLVVDVFDLAVSPILEPLVLTYREVAEGIISTISSHPEFRAPPWGTNLVALYLLTALLSSKSHAFHSMLMARKRGDLTTGHTIYGYLLSLMLSVLLFANPLGIQDIRYLSYPLWFLLTLVAVLPMYVIVYPIVPDRILFKLRLMEPERVSEYDELKMVGNYYLGAIAGGLFFLLMNFYQGGGELR